MNVQLGGGAWYDIRRAALRLEGGSGTVISLRFGVHHPDREEQLALAAAMAPGEFSWDNGLLPFQTIGFETRERVDHLEGEPARVLEVDGLVMAEEVKARLESSPDLQGRPVGIYQRQEATDVDGWSFLRRVLGDLVAMPAGADRLNTTYPLGACLCRLDGHDNRQFLDQVIADLARRLPSIGGWFATGAAETADPLRLIVLDETAAVTLGAGWTATGRPLPCPFTRDVQSTDPCRLQNAFAVIDPLAALAALARGESQERLAALIDAGLASGFVPGPGAVRIGGRRWFCRAVTYSSVEANPGYLDASLELRRIDSLPVGEAMPSRRLRGAFEGWSQQGTNAGRFGTLRPWAAEIQDSDPRDWILIGPDGPDAQRMLLARMLKPGATRDDHAGIYVTHRRSDELAFEVEPARVPEVGGGYQYQSPEIEKADLVLNAPKIALSGSPSNSPLEDARRIGLGLANAETVDIQVATKIIVRAETIAIDGDLDVRE